MMKIEEEEKKNIPTSNSKFNQTKHVTYDVTAHDYTVDFRLFLPFPTICRFILIN